MMPVAAVVLLGILGADSDPDAIAVMPIQAKRVEESVVRVLDDLLVGAVDDLHRYKIVSAEDISALLGHEKLKDAVGCSDVGCAAEIGGALGTRYLLAGTVSRLGSKMLVTLRLIDTRLVEAVGRVTSEVDNDEDEYAKGIRVAVRELFSNITAQRDTPPPASSPEAPPEPAIVEEPAKPAFGALRVVSEPAGAAVVLNSVLVGQTPLALDQQPEGDHVLNVNAAGFAALEESLFIQGNGVTEVQVQLLSEADAAVRADRRFWSLLSLGSAVVLGGGGAAALVLNTSQKEIDTLYDRYKAGEIKYRRVNDAIMQHNIGLGVGLGLIAAGMTALGIGGWLFFDVPSPQLAVTFN